MEDEAKYSKGHSRMGSGATSAALDCPGINMGSIFSTPSSTAKTSTISTIISNSKISSISKSSSNGYASSDDDAIANLKTGCMIAINRATLSGLLGFYHFALYIEGGYVIHLTQFEASEYCECSDDLTYLAGNTATACRYCQKSYKYVVVSELLEDVLKKDTFTVVNFFDRENSPLSEDEIIANAKSLLGPVHYDLSVCNCEHFANWCRYGVAVSFQAVTKWFNAKEYKQIIAKAFTNNKDFRQSLKAIKLVNSKWIMRTTTTSTARNGIHCTPLTEQLDDLDDAEDSALLNNTISLDEISLQETESNQRFSSLECFNEFRPGNTARIYIVIIE